MVASLLLVVRPGAPSSVLAPWYWHQIMEKPILNRFDTFQHMSEDLENVLLHGLAVLDGRSPTLDREKKLP